MGPSLQALSRRWPLREPFAISGRVFTSNLGLEVRVTDGDFTGKGECEPHEHDLGVALAAQSGLEVMPAKIWNHLDPLRLNALMPRSAVRNALDCALWDLRAKRAGRRAWELLGLELESGQTFPIFETLSLDTPERMHAAAAASRGAPGLKVKLGHADGRDAERLEAVRAAAPGIALTIDANEGWSLDALRRMLPLARKWDVLFIEQPVPSGIDAALSELPRSVRFCADESCLDRGSLPSIVGRYQLVNIKLDKTGGVTEALALVAEARSQGLGYMVGCNGGSSLAQAPALLLAPGAAMVDLGVHGLAEDQPASLDSSGHRIGLPARALWG